MKKVEFLSVRNVIILIASVLLSQVSFQLGIQAIGRYLEFVPLRTVTQKENVMLLWNKDIKHDPLTDRSKLFETSRRSIVFFNHNESSLSSFNMITGETIWKTFVPHDNHIFLFDDWFFVTNSSQNNWLSLAPNLDEFAVYKCLSRWGGMTEIFAYDANTGEKKWAYRYVGTNSSGELGVGKNYLSLDSFHRDSPTISIDIDRNLGHVTDISCLPPRIGSGAPPEPKSSIYQAVFVERQITWGSHAYHLLVEGNKLMILSDVTRKRIGFIEFSGSKLDRNSIRIINQKHAILIYLMDSNQFFAFMSAD